MTVVKIISGGQTGADQGGWAAAKELGLETGGQMPKGFKTELYPRPDFVEKWGVTESFSSDYPHRTAQNIRDSDGTVLFGNSRSRGSALTHRLCLAHKKPVFLVPILPPLSSSLPNFPYWKKIAEFVLWTEEHNIRVLNVAGNRESKFPGIHDFTRDFIVEALKIV